MADDDKKAKVEDPKENKEPEAKGKEPTDSKDSGKIKIPWGDTELELTPQEVTQIIVEGKQAATVLQKGIKEGLIDPTTGEFIKPKEPKKPDKEPEDDEETELAKLRKELSDFKNQNESDKIQREMSATMQREAAALKLDEDDQQLVNTLATAEYYLNPNQNFKNLYKNVAKTVQQLADKKAQKIIESKIKAQEDKGEGPGGKSFIPEGKKMTAKDLKRGSIAKSLQEGLAALRKSSSIG